MTRYFRCFKDVGTVEKVFTGAGSSTKLDSEILVETSGSVSEIVSHLSVFLSDFV